MTDKERADELVRLLDNLLADVSDCSGIDMCEPYIEACDKIGGLR